MKSSILGEFGERPKCPEPRLNLSVVSCQLSVVGEQGTEPKEASCQESGKGTRRKFGNGGKLAIALDEKSK